MIIIIMIKAGSGRANHNNIIYCTVVITYFPSLGEKLWGGGWGESIT